MAELTFEAPLPRVELRDRLRGRLDALRSGLQLIAEDVLGDETRIDLVALDADGRATLVLVAEPGHELERVADALAQREWLAPRLADWCKLAPQLRILPEAGVFVLVVGNGFEARARALARTLGADDCELVIARAVRNGTATGLLLEPLREAARNPALPGESGVRSLFRSGLTDAQLGLSTEERREFET
jgi:hypothetical protein